MRPANVPPLSPFLRNLMAFLLVAAVAGGSLFAFVRNNTVKPATTTGTTSCVDPVEENRLRQALRQNTNDFVAQMDWGAYNLRCKEDFPAAISAFELAVGIAKANPDRIAPEDRFDASIALGQAYLRTNRLQQAESAFREVVDQEPNNSLALVWLGSALYLKDPQQAIPYLEKVLTLEPGSDLAKLAQSLLDDIKQGKARPRPTPTTR
jgi:tetratricopeptide (TPR) repeat protein